MTVAALHSLEEQTKLSFELIVVDNLSTDGSAEAINAGFPSVRLLKLKQNVGFAKANNLAAAYATGEYILLLNPDTLIQDRAVDRLLKFAEDQPDALIWGGRTLFGDGKLNPGSCWSKQTVWSLLSQALGLTYPFRKSSFFNPEEIGGWDRTGIRRVDIVSGCFLLIKRAFWDRLDGFCPDFFMYGEDADLCLRAARLGAKPAVTSEATIVHYGGASEKIAADKLVRQMEAKQSLISRHFHTGTVHLGRVLLAIYPLSRFFVCFALSLFGSKVAAGESKKWGEVVWRYREWFSQSKKC